MADDEAASNELDEAEAWKAETACRSGAVQAATSGCELR